MATVCDECGETKALSLCEACAGRLTDALYKAGEERDRAATPWLDAFDAAVKLALGKKPEELTVADCSAPWGKWIGPLLEVYRGKP